MSEEFGGDVLLYDTLDGAEIEIKNGLVMADEGFRTAVYLSLFGGNSDDTGEVVNNKTWWGNCLEGLSGNEKLVGRFAAFVRSVPMSSKNIALAESKARQDLQWFLDDGIADSVEVEITSGEKNKINLSVKIGKAGEILEAGNYSMQWESMKNGI